MTDPTQPVDPAPVNATMAMGAALLLRVDALISKLEAKEASVGTYVAKYWPIAVGILIAATRLIH